jgi:hypothetical protein
MGNDISISRKLHFEIISDKNKARELLDLAEKKDFYVEECFDNTANSIARAKMTYTPNTISFRDVTYAKAYLESMLEILPQRLLLDLDTINIIQLMPTADGGMPHTRPENIICLPDISQLFSNTTLIHELWHVHQRKFQDVWYNVFKSIGWREWDGPIPDQLEKNRRYNPDTIDCPLWIYNDNWIPVPIFKSITNPKINDIDIWFYNPNKRYHTYKIPDELSTYFTNLPSVAYEHPREITAYMLSEPEKYDNKAMSDLIGSIGYTSLPKKIT